jgi:hypothetical protein
MLYVCCPFLIKSFRDWNNANISYRLNSHLLGVPIISDLMKFFVPWSFPLTNGVEMQWSNTLHFLNKYKYPIHFLLMGNRIIKILNHYVCLCCCKCPLHPTDPVDPVDAVQKRRVESNVLKQNWNSIESKLKLWMSFCIDTSNRKLHRPSLTRSKDENVKSDCKWRWHMRKRCEKKTEWNSHGSYLSSWLSFYWDLFSLQVIIHPNGENFYLVHLPFYCCLCLLHMWTRNFTPTTIHTTIHTNIQMTMTTVNFFFLSILSCGIWKQRVCFTLFNPLFCFLSWLCMVDKRRWKTIGAEWMEKAKMRAR